MASSSDTAFSPVEEDAGEVAAPGGRARADGEGSKNLEEGKE
jgi:hypothetical protein